MNLLINYPYIYIKEYKEKIKQNILNGDSDDYIFKDYSPNENINNSDNSNENINNSDYNSYENIYEETLENLNKLTDILKRTEKRK